MTLLSLLIQYNIKDLTDEVFVPLEFYPSQKKRHWRYSLFGNVIDPRRRRLQLHCCETLKLRTVYLYICVGGYCTLSKDMKKFKSRKPSSLVPCPSCDAGTNLHFSLTTFVFHSCTSVIPVQYLHISSKNCNCLCHVILFINFYHFCKRQIVFILVINQLDAQNLFYNKFISYLYMFRAPCAHRQEAWNKLIVKQILCIKLVNY